MIGEKTMELKTASDVIACDLNYICEQLHDEFNCLSGKHVLLTGGAGFLGHYLVQAALHWNATIGRNAPAIRMTVFDSLVRGYPGWLSDRKGDKNLVVLQHDIRNPFPVPIEDFNYIIHAASIASPTYYRRDPIATMDANINGLRTLLDYAHHQKNQGTPLDGFLFFSSSEIYGDPSPESIPTPETYRGFVSCTGPRACYDEAKRYGETLCVNFSQQLGLPIKVARPFNNYGPGLKISDRRVIPDFARDILSGRDIVMLSDGSPRRTYCYTADAIVGYYKILVKGVPGEAYNVGVESPEISVAGLADKLVGFGRELFGYKGKVVHQTSDDQSYLIDNPNRRCPIIEKARNHVGYNPTVALDEGLRRSMIWYGDNQVAEDS